MFFWASLSLTLGRDFTFLSYNLKNFLYSSHQRKGEEPRKSFKPATEIEALISVITKASPDILGICEIGTMQDLTQFQSLLTKAGLNYQYMEYVDAADSTRHLALLSKFPIVQRLSCNRYSYQICGDNYPLRRGLLHVALRIGEDTVHVIGAHLKSQRLSTTVDQAYMRLNEAHLCRKHINKFLEQHPGAKLLLYGDFNDSFRSKPLSILKGFYGTPFYLKPLNLCDSRGDYWTHYWDHQREYSVFDYVLCNKPLVRAVDLSQSRIIDSPETTLASDHRPLFVKFSLSDTL